MIAGRIGSGGRGRGRPAGRTSALAVVALGAGLAAASPAHPPEQPNLHRLLSRLSRTAMLFRDEALHFACKETISWKGVALAPDSAQFEYVFVHEEGEFRDYRTPRSYGKRRSAPREVEPEEFGVPMYLRSAYLWIFTFRSDRQRLHRYRILGWEEEQGILAVKMEFEPIPPYREKLNDWFGTAWVDPELGQLLKVVAYRPEDHETRGKVGAFTGVGMVDEVTATYDTFTTWFTEEKNGLRFPGRVELEEAKYRWIKTNEHRKIDAVTGLEKAQKEPGRIKKSRSLMKVTQDYRKYQFFSVRSAEEIRGYILRGKKLILTP